MTDWTVTFLGNKNQPKGTLEAEDMFTVSDRVDRYASQCQDILQANRTSFGRLAALGDDIFRLINNQ